jgi:hypothetical protein
LTSYFEDEQALYRYHAPDSTSGFTSGWRPSSGKLPVKTTSGDPLEVEEGFIYTNTAIDIDMFRGF